MNIAVLGSTGSIGRQTLETIRGLSGEPVKVRALAAGSDDARLFEQILEFRPALAALFDENAALRLRERLREHGVTDTEVSAGMDGLLSCAEFTDIGMVVNAMVGGIGLRPTLAAIAAGKNVALANKETLVTAGGIVMGAAEKRGVKILPIDSEHSAIWQCLRGNEGNAVRRIILTASGGAFRTRGREFITEAKAAEALRHPNWKMGPKITVDCATMMNKGLEFIEAQWLYGLPYEKIEIVVHPQSIIHSMVEFEDGAVIAQLSEPDMRLPIQYAIMYPKRLPNKQFGGAFDFYANSTLTFEKPDTEKFPCLSLALCAAKTGGTLPAVMNTLNEIAVAAYLKDEIKFYDISNLIEEAFGAYTVKPANSLSDIEEAEQWARQYALNKSGHKNGSNICQY